MRVAIDARLNAYRQGGISQYTRQLLTALPEVARDDEFVSLQHRDHLRPIAIAPNVLRRTVFTPPHHRFEQWTLPLEVMLARPQVLHSPDFIAPLRRTCPAVVTIHDLAFMHYPEILDDAARAYYSQVKANAPRADGIIAVSEATRQDIAQFIDLPIEQIDVIYEAAAPLFQRISLREGEARVLNATPVEADSFLLFVSTLEPRKNLPTLLQALRICIDRRPDAGYRLVIVGRRGWRDEPIFTAVRDLNLGEHVLFAGGVGQYDLRWLYNACRMYINPSLYEGFGLPLLEAMACGAPCLAAATSSLPEIGGNAALYVPPLDAAAWADEIEALWADEARRAELSRLGMARAQQFSWIRAARETLDVYRRAAERRAAPASAAAPVHAPLSSFDTPASPRLAASPAGPRACVQCGADLVPGVLQHHLAMQPAENDGQSAPLAPRLWACSRCGYVELVVDWAAALPAQAQVSLEPAHTDTPTDEARSAAEPWGEQPAPAAALADEVGQVAAQPLEHAIGLAAEVPAATPLETSEGEPGAPLMVDDTAIATDTPDMPANAAIEDLPVTAEDISIAEATASPPVPEEQAEVAAELLNEASIGAPDAMPEDYAADVSTALPIAIVPVRETTEPLAPVDSVPRNGAALAAAQFVPTAGSDSDVSVAATPDAPVQNGVHTSGADTTKRAAKASTRTTNRTTEPAATPAPKRRQSKPKRK